MNTKEFILELEAIHHMFDWHLTPDGSRYAEQRAIPRFRIRGTLKDRPDGVRFEPIGAVCFARTNMAFADDYWVEAALSIGLPLQEARDMIAAANDLAWRTVGAGREPDPYRQGLRAQFIEITGVQLPAPGGAGLTLSARPEL